jgi:hypothetical protein
LQSKEVCVAEIENGFRSLWKAGLVILFSDISRQTNKTFPETFVSTWKETIESVRDVLGK